MKSIHKRQKSSGVKEFQDLQNIENLLKKTENYVSRKVETIPQTIKVLDREIPLNQIRLSEHSLKRAIERLELKFTKLEDVQAYVRKLLTQAEYIGRITDTSGSESEMFLVGNNSIQVNTDFTKVTTILKKEKSLPYSPISDKVSSIMRKEFRKLDRTERSRSKRLERFRYEAKAEISNLKLKSFKTRSDAVRIACESRIAALSMELTHLENELSQIKTDKRQIAYALMSTL